MDWLQTLGWDKREVDDLRYVAYSYIKQGVYDVALTFFNALAVLTEQTAYDLQTIGALHLQLGNNQEALNLLDRALKLDPEHLPTQLNRAKALISLGDKKEGVKQAKELEKSPDPNLRREASALVLANQ